MNYVAYQPAFDVYHTEFRILRLIIFGGVVEVDVDQLRIADFYLLFFPRLTDVRLFPAHRKIKRLARESRLERYEIQPEDRLLFARMSAIQVVALRALAISGIINKERLELGFVAFTGAEIASDILDRVVEANLGDRERMESLEVLMTQYPLNGVGGLKERTRLMEHKYDAI